MAGPSALDTTADRWGWPAVVAVVVGALLVVGVLGALAPDTSENPDPGEAAANGSDSTDSTTENNSRDIDETDDDDTPELTWTVTVTDVVDGDTVDIRYQNGSTDTVRLLGIDTPEVHTSVSPAEFEGVPDTPAARECLGTVGGRASAYVRNRLDGETVTLRVDPQADRRGVYGRLLAYIVENGTNLNYDLVAQGYARVFDSPFRQSDRFYAAEADAQSTQQRVWACRTAEEESPDETDDSETSRRLTVARIHADAAGNDHENLNDEYVVFANTGESALELSGWTVADEADHTYRFPTGFTLGGGERVTLYTGSGSPSATELYWGQDQAVWNNGGDTVIVSNADGEVILEESY
jgi:micrococcal nuclease